MEEYELLEFSKDILRFIDQAGQKNNFYSWLESQGFDVEDAKSKIESIKNL